MVSSVICGCCVSIYFMYYFNRCDYICTERTSDVSYMGVTYV